PPQILHRPSLRLVADAVLARLSVGIGYLPSSVSPPMRLTLQAPAAQDGEPTLRVTSDHASGDVRSILHAVGRRLTRFAPDLDLWPVLPRMVLSATGKSYHWGGSFPLSNSTESRFSTDRIGRLQQWRRVHLVDASVLPSLA